MTRVLRRLVLQQQQGSIDFDTNNLNQTMLMNVANTDDDEPDPDDEDSDDGWINIIVFIITTIQLTRLAIDLIQYVSNKAGSSSTPTTDTGSTTATTITSTNTDNTTTKGAESTTRKVANGTDTLLLSSSSITSPKETTTTTATPNDSTLLLGGKDTTKADGASSSTAQYGATATVVANAVTDDERKSLLLPEVDSTNQDDNNQQQNNRHDSSWQLKLIAVWCIMTILYIVPCVTKLPGNNQTIYSYKLLYFTSFTIPMEIFLFIIEHSSSLTTPFAAINCTYGIVQQFLDRLLAVILWSTYAILYIQSYSPSSSRAHKKKNAKVDFGLLMLTTFFLIITILVGYLTHYYIAPSESGEVDKIATKDDTDKMKGKTEKKKQLSWSAIAILVKPYVWPNAVGPNSTATMNRLRAIGTWICVIASKYCNLISPLYLGWSSTALAHGDYKKCIRYAIYYNVISWLASTLKEGQSLMYLKVKQAAFVQLSQTAFGHLHSLSLDWHLRKKLGEVLRSMDRGISACDTIMNYLFLWLIPAVVECIVVCIIFATYFKYFPLGVTVFYFVFVYIVWTIVLTVWRKKFRKALALHDNEWHDRFTDSMINFETVKFFTAEQYEMDRFVSAVRQYQAGSVNVQSSLSMLNISQQVILKLCLATALSLSAIGIQKRVTCCVETMGCDSGISDCCRSISQSTCPGMQVGDFVAVLTYTLNLFTPLNFLGSVYNSIVMAMIDLGSMSELLAESPDVTDAPDAMTLPPTNPTNPDVAIEFDNVVFNYPTQPKERGLKGLSFTIKPGTTTAIVGPTGAGKTTVSRLLFRFYDVVGGAVKVNGIDVRSLKQDSLRGAIGVVPQAASMFNDTIRNNILYGRRDATDEEVVQAATDAQLIGFIESLDDGWDTMVGDRGLKLSGGEKQRAAIARCLLKNPPFILLDEATASLDTLTENSVQVALDRLGAQRTVLVIAHRLGTIRNADKIIVLKDGRAYEEGTHDELLLKNGLYAEMWNMQLHSTSTSTSQVNLTSL